MVPALVDHRMHPNHLTRWTQTGGYRVSVIHKIFLADLIADLIRHMIHV